KPTATLFSNTPPFVLVAELGLDPFYSSHVDAPKHAVTPLNPPYVEVPAGSGPRRLQLHPNGRFLYVNHETDSKVTVFEINNGALKAVQTLSTLPADYKGNNST